MMFKTVELEEDKAAALEGDLISIKWERAVRL